MKVRVSRHKEDPIPYLRVTGVVEFCDVETREELEEYYMCLIPDLSLLPKAKDYMQKHAAVSLLD